MWQDILKKTNTYAETYIQLYEESTEKWVNWLDTLDRNELDEARGITEEEFNNIEQVTYNLPYSEYIENIEMFIENLWRKKQDAQDRAWVKVDPEKAKERDKRNEESRLRNQKSKEESDAKEEARNRKIWESHARAKTAKRKPSKRKGQRRRY